MKKTRYLVLAFITCLVCSCYQEMLFEDDSLDEEIVADFNPNPFSFRLLFPATNGETHYSFLGATRFLTKNQHGMMSMLIGNFGQDNLVLSKMAEKLYKRNIVIKCAIAPNMNNGQYAGKDAIYDSRENIIYFKYEDGFMNSRIILHELLHAFQIHLAGVEYTPENESQTEFEVLLMYDVMKYREGIISSEGGNDKEYQNFVHQIANFELSAEHDKSIEGLMKMFGKHYRKWASISETATISFYRPSLLIYFLRYSWNY